YFGGASAAAIDVGAQHADVYMLWGEPLTAARERLNGMRAAALRHGRSLRFSLSVRPIIAPTESAAWRKAEDIAERALAQRQRFLSSRGRREDSSVGSARLRAAAAEREVHDTRLWTRVAAITGAAGNSTALVGTPEQVAESLLAYVDLGIEALLIRGFSPLEDAIDYGRELIPLIRQAVGRRESTRLAAASAAER
ncbi:MAG: LLM class flavin-dependent oxidoreductase, partial [Chloroflexi bacterium]|nr:LLM class flavin-dependent oxidoreductase [Chloroflexota bacterium]